MLKPILFVFVFTPPVAWLLLAHPVLFACLFGAGVGLALAVYWSMVFDEYKRRQPAQEPLPIATVDGRPVKSVEVIP
jgi:hypothetical protein